MIMKPRVRPVDDEPAARKNGARPRDLNESTLILLAQKGDKKAFEGIYRCYVGRVYALCLRLSGDRTMAEELAQDVFVRIWEKLPSFRGESAFSSWLHRLTVNVVLGAQRSRARRESRVTVMEDPAESPGTGIDYSPHISMDLEKAIASLPAGARTVFVLHDIEGYQHSEIAELNEIAPGTSKAQLHWARKHLREMLEK